MKIAVIGASGFVGQEIAVQAANAGNEVIKVKAPRLRTTKRSAAHLATEASHNKTSEIEALAKLLSGAEVVINAAGLAAPGSHMTDELVGANALLPGLVVLAAVAAHSKRVVQVSSAAVHGNVKVLDARVAPTPSSPYGQSKLWGEEAITILANQQIQTLIYRPTSVPGDGRTVTAQVKRLASSFFSTVASPGDSPTPQVLVEDVGRLAVELATQVQVPLLPVIHPWEGRTVSSFLEEMGQGRTPKRIPRWIAHSILGVAKQTGRLNTRVLAQSRRLEMLWFGQAQASIDESPMIQQANSAQQLTVGILSQWFDPEPGPAALPGALARGLISRGYRVKVLTGVPNYPIGRVYKGFANNKTTSVDESGIEITRVPLIVSHSSSGTMRALNYLSFALSARFFGKAALDDVDLIWVYNSPPSIVYPLSFQKKRTKVPVFTHVMDLWPDSYLATAFSNGRLQKVLVGIFKFLTTRTYGLSERIAYISPGVYDILLTRGVEKNKLTYVPTWVEPHDLKLPSAPSKLKFDPIPGQRTLVYAGAVGSVQGLDLIVEAMLLNPQLPLHLLIIGTGTAKADLMKQSEDANNITFLDPVDSRDMHLVYAIADCMIISLGSSPLAQVTTPSKFSQILQQRLPVLAIGGGDLEVQVQAANAGVSAAANLDSIVTLLNQISLVPNSQLDDWGSSGQRYYEEHLSYSVLIDKIDSEFRQLFEEETG